MLDLENPSGGAPPLDSGRPIKVGFRTALRLVIDAGATTMPPEAQPFHSGKSRDGYTLVGTRSVGPSGPGWLGSTTSHLQANTAAGLNDELLQLPANCDFTCQFVVDNVGVASGTPCWFRSGTGASSSNLFLATDTRRPWLRISGTDVLRPASGAQWTDGQTINLIVRNKHATRTEAWWDGALRHSATHSSSIPALTGIEAIFYLLTNSVADELRGNAVAIRFWSRYLGDAETAELAADHGALYEPDQVWVPVSAGGTSIATGTSTETDTALALNRVLLRAAGTSTETDTALALSQVLVRATGAATEIDSALALTFATGSSVGVAAEADTALALSQVLLRAAGTSTETDTAQALGQVLLRVAGASTETDTALALAPALARAVGVATETDTALALSVASGLSVGRADEVDTALALGQVQLRAVGRADETDTALALNVGSAFTAGRADESDVAFALGVRLVAAVGTATETDAAQALGQVQLAAVGRADETDAAQALSPLLRLTAGLSLEIDTSFALQRLLLRQVGRADEIDQAAVPSIGFDLLHVVSPRAYAVNPERRSYFVNPEDRVYVVPPNARSTDA